MIRRSRVVIVICPSLRGDGAPDRSAGPDGADRERAGLGGGSRRRPAAGGRGSPRRWRSTDGHADRALHGHVRGLSGARPAVRRRWRSSDGHGPDARLVLAGGQAGSGRARAGPGPRGRHRATRRSSPASVRRRRFRRTCSPADVLVSPRSRGHEHAAEDLSVSAVGKADRRHAAADAHAGPERRDGDSHRRDRRASLPTASSRRWPTRRGPRTIGARARELAETKYSYEAYLDAHAPGLRGADGRPPPRIAAGQGRRVTARTVALSAGSLQLQRLRRSGNRRGRSTIGGSAGRSASSSPARRRACWRTSSAGFRSRDDPRRRHRHRPGGAAPGPRRRAG